jgi:hypothetical protein
MANERRLLWMGYPLQQGATSWAHRLIHAAVRRDRPASAENSSPVGMNGYETCSSG